MANPYVEQDCTITHEGKQFTSGGAFVSDTHIIAYLKDEPQISAWAYGTLTDWHGNPLGTFRALSVWSTPRSFISSRMWSVEMFVNGVRYVGRTCGKGMIVRGKRSPKQPKGKQVSK